MRFVARHIERKTIAGELAGKVAVITGTSPSAIGTAVGQQHLRQVLGILGSLVIGGEAYISFKPDLIDEDGGFAIESTRAFLKAYMEPFLAIAAKLAVQPDCMS